MLYIERDIPYPAFGAIFLPLNLGCVLESGAFELETRGDCFS